MARLPTRPDTELGTEILELLEPARVNGKLADVYLQFANSESALAAYLGMEKSLRQSSLSDREIEAIKLLVSELTQCKHCLAMHTMKARKAGLDKPAQLAIRSGQPIDDQRIDVIVKMVLVFFKEPGTLDDALVTEALTASLSHAELMDIAMAVSTIFFTNIANHINDTRSTLPSAPSLVAKGT